MATIRSERRRSDRTVSSNAPVAREEGVLGPAVVHDDEENVKTAAKEKVVGSSLNIGRMEENVCYSVCVHFFPPSFENENCSVALNRVRGNPRDRKYSVVHKRAHAGVAATTRATNSCVYVCVCVYVCT